MKDTKFVLRTCNNFMITSKVVKKTRVKDSLHTNYGVNDIMETVKTINT